MWSSGTARRRTMNRVRKTAKCAAAPSTGPRRSPGRVLTCGHAISGTAARCIREPSPMKNVRCFAVLTISVTLCAAAAAQPERTDRYEWHGFDSNLESMLQKYLEKSRKQPFDKLQQMLREQFNAELDPEAFNVDLSKEQYLL